jgi:hypothetical protein
MNEGRKEGRKEGRNQSINQSFNQSIESMFVAYQRRNLFEVVKTNDKISDHRNLEQK